MKIVFSGEQIKLEVWSVFFGSIVISMLILFAGNIIWLLFSGFIFGSMSGRGYRDIFINGFASLFSTLPILFFFNINSIPGVDILSGIFRYLNVPLAGDGLIIIISFILSGSGAFAGSEITRHYLKVQNTEGHGQ